MKTNLFKAITLSTICIIIKMNVLAQPRATLFTDLGQNIVRNGLFVKNSGVLSYQFGKYVTEAGFQSEFNNRQKVLLSAIAVKFSKEFQLKRSQVVFQSFYIFTPISSVLNETNLGIISSLKYKHLDISFGTNYRSFAYTSKAIRNFEIQSNVQIHEIWNFIYSFGFYLKPIVHPWNVAFMITDQDYFAIEHETNPILVAKALCQLNHRIKLFVEFRCKENFPFNFNMNYFEISQRTGIIFNI